MKSREVIVLAGGLGTRLRSLVSDVPKPLAPVAGRPFLAWVLDALAAQQVRRVILATGYLGHKVVESIGKNWNGMEIAYSQEDSPLGTGGAILKACAILDGESAHVLNGDTYLRYSLGAVEQDVHEHRASLGMALTRVPDVSRYGAVVCEGGMVVTFSEKGIAGPGFINAGSYFLTGDAIGRLPRRESFSFEQDYLRGLVGAGKVCAHTATEGFIDIGVPEDFERAQHLFAKLPYG